jgi:hypothetical protein
MLSPHPPLGCSPSQQRHRAEKHKCTQKCRGIRERVHRRRKRRGWVYGDLGAAGGANVEVKDTQRKQMGNNEKRRRLTDDTAHPSGATPQQTHCERTPTRIPTSSERKRDNKMHPHRNLDSGSPHRANVPPPAATIRTRPHDDVPSPSCGASPLRPLPPASTFLLSATLVSQSPHPPVSPPPPSLPSPLSPSPTPLLVLCLRPAIPPPSPTSYTPALPPVPSLALPHSPPPHCLSLPLHFSHPFPSVLPLLRPPDQPSTGIPAAPTGMPSVCPSQDDLRPPSHPHRRVLSHVILLPPHVRFPHTAPALLPCPFRAILPSAPYSPALQLHYFHSYYHVPLTPPRSTHPVHRLSPTFSSPPSRPHIPSPRSPRWARYPFTLTLTFCPVVPRTTSQIKPITRDHNLETATPRSPGATQHPRPAVSRDTTLPPPPLAPAPSRHPSTRHLNRPLSLLCPTSPPLRVCPPTRISTEPCFAP